MQLRVEKLGSLRREENCTQQIDIMHVCINDAADRLNKYGKDAINSFAEGDEQRMMLMGLKRFTKHEAVNAKVLRRQIADKLINDNGYLL